MIGKYSFIGWTARVLDTRGRKMGVELLEITAQEAKAINSMGSPVITVHC